MLGSFAARKYPTLCRSSPQNLRAAARPLVLHPAGRQKLAQSALAPSLPCCPGLVPVQAWITEHCEELCPAGVIF